MLLLSWFFAFLIVTNRFPPADRGSGIFAVRSTQMANLVAKMLQECLGEPAPRFRADDSYVERTILWDGTIINVPSQKAIDDVDNSSAALARVVKDPHASAEEVARFFHRNGHKAKVIHDPSPGVRKGSMSFVVVYDLRWTIVLRKSFDKMGKMPPKWTPYTKQF